MEIRELHRSGADRGVGLWSSELEGVGFRGEVEALRLFVLGAIVKEERFKNGVNRGWRRVWS